MDRVLVAAVIFVLAVGAGVIFTTFSFTAGVAVFVLWLLLSIWFANNVRLIC